MARITRIVPAGDSDDGDRGRPRGEKVVELSDVDGDTVAVFDLGTTYHLRIVGDDGYRYAELPPLILQTLALQILAHENKKNHN